MTPKTPRELAIEALITFGLSHTVPYPILYVDAILTSGLEIIPADSSIATLRKALAEMLSLFDDYGTMTADFAHLSDAIDSGYAALEKSRESGNQG